ncbi:PH domain-containing protein [Corynebacterium sp. TAE3-ERU12]|uniref:PH domain-containing protein n=1 Tax=Corynebacterium sp. TAE3-ERU12 TaxID=2849491 RepID=UPI001C44C6F8|nr:PH domain-containing protein [Corynebacterium sp. TAE3-ERU12]MBV7295580.1 PH domain-containing protein [Corynebacterium sp. TAE3-ERU12]
MAFPDDELFPGEYVRIDVNPTFGRLVLPLLELILATGVAWILIGVLDGSLFNGSELAWLRSALVLGWLAVVGWRTVLPGLRWLGERFVLTNQRVILRRGVLRRAVVTVHLTEIAGATRAGNTLLLHVDAYHPPMAIRDVPKIRTILRMMTG